jgi:hypothetical protein
MRSIRRRDRAHLHDLGVEEPTKPRTVQRFLQVKSRIVLGLRHDQERGHALWRTRRRSSAFDFDAQDDVRDRHGRGEGPPTSFRLRRAPSKPRVEPTPVSVLAVPATEVRSSKRELGDVERFHLR